MKDDNRNQRASFVWEGEGGKYKNPQWYTAE